MIDKKESNRILRLANYTRLLSLTRLNAKYSLHLGTCPVCLSEKALIVSCRNIPPWGCCSKCNVSSRLTVLIGREPGSRRSAKQEALWYIYTQARRLFLSGIPSTKLLNRLNIPPHRADPAYTSFFSNFVGYYELNGLRKMLRIADIKIPGGVEWPRIASKTPALLVPVQRTPGYITGFAVFSEDREEIWQFPKYDEENDKFWIHVTSSKNTHQFNSLQEACLTGQLYTNNLKPYTVVADPVLDEDMFREIPVNNLQP